MSSSAPCACDDCRYLCVSDGPWPDMCELEEREVTLDDYERPSWCPFDEV